MLDHEVSTDLADEATPASSSQLTPLQAVRAECLSCCNGSANEVRLCPVKRCALWPLRFGRRGPDAPVSIVKAIREKCIDCSGGSLKEVTECGFAHKCSLFPFRMGTNPNRKGCGGGKRT